MLLVVRLCLLLLISCLCCQPAFACSDFTGKSALQVVADYTVSGTLRDATTGETLIGASVAVPSLQLGTTTNEYGFYSLTVPGGDSLTIRFSYVGYAPVFRRVSLTQNLTLNLELGSGLSLAEVTVVADDLANRMRSTQMSLEQVDARDAKLIPALLGEADILKTIQLKPGIPSGAEGTTGIYVRGGGADQNLIILDDAVVYNANHLFGFFSTFNTDAVKDLKLYKGGFPAQYGGRLSSVIDVRLRDGNTKKFSGKGGLGAISSRLTLEGPLAADDKASFIVSGRRTYVDLITNQVNKINEDKEDFNKIPAYNFYDLNAKVNYQLSANDRLYVSGYFGRDKFGFDDENFDFGFNWGNETGTIRWNHIYGPRLFANTTATFSNYEYVVRNEIPGFTFEVGSAIKDVNLKTDYFFNFADRQTLRFGASITHHNFEVGRLQAGSTDGEVSFSAGNDFTGLEFGAYVGDELSLGQRLQLSAGLRLSGFANDGVTYLRPEPRVAANYAASERIGIKASYARMNQYVHLVSSAGVALPTDVWYPSTRRVKPQQSDQLALGASYLIRDGLLFTTETYYKFLRNQVDFIDGAELFVNDDLEQDFDFGKGYAYGFEAQLERTKGKLRGWIGYTWQKTRRGNFPNIMQGRYFSPRFDRRHDVSVVGMYELNRRWTFTATWVYGSGDLYWLPIGRKLEQGTPGGDIRSVLPIYGDRNNYRLIPFHRGDISAVMKFFPKWGESDLTFSVFNVYDRRNAFFVYIDISYEDLEGASGELIRVPERLTPKQVSLFPILPSITWNFEF